MEFGMYSNKWCEALRWEKFNYVAIADENYI